MRYRIFKRARQQLIDIWIYTEQKWGDRQSDQYIDGLYKAFKEISEDSHSWRKVRGKKFVGVFFFRYEKHFVFFKQLTSGDVGIISVLHEKMNVPHHLLSDINEGEL